MSDYRRKFSDDSDPGILGGRYTVHFEKPLPQLDSPLAKAYAATDNRAAARGLFALVCRADLMPRIDVIPQFHRFRRIPVLTPVDAGPISIPDGDGRRFIIVFERPSGERVLPSPDAKIPPLREDQVVRRVIKPLLPAFKELSNRFLPHRAIRADNLFYTDVGRTAVSLGECVSGPPGMSQPVLYEPIEAGMAQPSGRGPGRINDDLYAFGVTIAILLSGGNPVADVSDEELLQRKINNGTYSTLVGHLRVSLSMMEPLRGLLCDDHNERWSVADLELWLGGRQLSPKQPMLPTRASRAITFAGQDIWNRFALSHLMGRHWHDAGQILKNGELESWIRRSYSDDETADAIAVAGGGGQSIEHTVSRILVVLRSQLPIRFRNISARIEGLIQAFAIEYHNSEMQKAFIEMMQAKLPQTYLQSTTGSRSDMLALMKTFDMINYFLDRPQLGFGIERALYESNRGWPCQSPIIKQDYVCEIEDLLPALERAAARGTAAEPMDRHIAAFCAARMRSTPERTLKMLAAPEQLATYRLGILHALAEAHRATGARRKFPALSEWLGRLLQPVVESFHNRAYRARLSEEIERVSGKGDLLELLFLADNLDAKTQDSGGFQKARTEHANLIRAIAWLEDGGLTGPSYVTAVGQQSATVVSAVVSGLFIVALTMMYVL